MEISPKQSGEMVEGNSADTCAKKFLLVSMGASRGSHVRRPGSEDHHRRERNSILFVYELKCVKSAEISIFTISALMATIKDKETSEGLHFLTQPCHSYIVTGQ